MSYIKSNKEAWEEAFDKRLSGWGDDHYKCLKSEKFAFFNDDMKAELENIDLKGKSIAQFCCNNGRELLSLVKSGAAKGGVGFDIAENILEQAKEMAEKADISNCIFVNCNILEISENYHEQFDLIFFTIGAITWFEDLTVLFEKASKCLKPGGLLLINDFHPLVNMLSAPGEKAHNPNDLYRVAYSYFSKDPFVENNGMGYISGEYESKTFISFVHTLSDIVNGLSLNAIKTTKLNEYDYDVGITDVYDGKGFPLSIILIGEKMA